MTYSVSTRNKFGRPRSMETKPVSKTCGGQVTTLELLTVIYLLKNLRFGGQSKKNRLRNQNVNTTND